MPPEVEACVESVLEDNPDYSKSRAYAICNAQQNQGNLSVGEDASHDELLRAAAEHDGECPAGQVYAGDSCVPVEEVDAPAPLLNSTPRIMASASPLDTQPIEREELSGGKVVYRGLKLIDTGVWVDANSETPTLYDEVTFKNTEPEYDTREYEGPPTNIAHDIHKAGPKKNEVHEASVGGWIDPDSLSTDGEAMFGDLILDRDTDAGAFADTNLKSALENDGTAGFSPSVELMPTELESNPDHPRAEEHVKEAELTGLGLVRDPASKSVDLAHETRNRAVALSSGEEVKTLHRESPGMSPEPHEEIRAEILQRELQVEEIQDDAEAIADELDIPVGEVMEVLDPLLDMDEEDEEGEGEGEGPPEMEEGDKPDDYDEEEEEEMQDGNEDLDAVKDQLANLSERLEEVEDAMADTLSEGDVEETREELSAAKSEIEDLREDKRELSQRVEQLEEVGEEPKTLTDSGEGEEFDFSDADEPIDYDRATGSMSQ